ncbi:sigma-70 family RNA polymerase sigma factor [Pseudomaricurvus alkylphenolicus]|uniref:RNA polymerase sigma factor n=1 Tax=Pseudomaricurvus alkylphenolicus TaxID=1306991 RepID=UPI001422CD42|nr:sigma-70 family RNA polymerase sigma factor [Pseudomaricurvus alkylphenolicus]NIB42718.1 sigma-70 family RNA polymerase sigma factor [Pseudomaricurvus alkylphenolicus]
MANNKHNRLESLFANHAKALVRFLKRKVNSEQDAEDIAQNAFIRIQRLAEEGELENPKAYLYQTASNLAIDMLRREKLHQNYLQQTFSRDQLADEEYSSLTDYCTPERLLSARRDLDNLQQAMNELPLKCRQAFLLHRVKGLSYSEIAKEMSVSVSSVEKYILQALKHSRKLVTGEEKR